MSDISPDQKNLLHRKYLEFRRAGLRSWGAHLLEQLDFAAKSPSRAAYGQYIENEIERNEKTLGELDEQLGDDPSTGRSSPN